MLTDDLKNLRSEFLLELRHRHEIIWRVRQVYSAALLAILVVLVRTKCLSVYQRGMFIAMVIGSLSAVMCTDWSYQKKKRSLLSQLYEVESQLKIPKHFCMGKPDQGFREFWTI